MIQNKKMRMLLLITTVCIGVLFRFYNLGSIPNSLNWDEVSWGYNGYSISQTGRDEYGSLFPLSFKAFGDYKQPVYVYLTAISVKFFGLTPFAVRFPSALLGSVSIVVVYALVTELFSKWQLKKQVVTAKIAIVAVACMAVSPWHIQFSRVAYEANVGLFFVLLGTWLFVKGINNKSWQLVFWSIIPMTVSAMTYHSEKIFSPVLFAGLLVYGYTFISTSKKLALGLVVLFILINSIWLIDVRTTARGRSVTIFANQTTVLAPSVKELEYDRGQRDFIGASLHNRRVVYAFKYVENYFSHFNPAFLFITGDDVRHHAPQMGVLYLASLVFILIGFRTMVFQLDRGTSLIFAWFLLAPAAASLAIDAPNASRSLIFLPTWHIFEAVGIISAWSYLASYRKKLFFQFGIVLIVLLYAGNILYYAHNYFVHTNNDTEWAWQYGYSQAIEKIETYKGKKIFFSDSIEQAYIFYLFHSHYDPAKYIASGGSQRRELECYAIDSVYFGKCSDRMIPGDILVSSDIQDKNTHKLLQEISYSNGKPSVYILEKKP